jgi:hypothetical protein
MNKKLFFILFLVIIPFVSADTISINSGGDTQLCMTSGDSIESCFFCVPTTCAKLGYNCGTWGDGCSKTLNCGTCGSGYTCTNGVCTAVPSEEEGPGGGGEVPGVTPSISVFPESINITILPSKSRDVKITITNGGTSTQTLAVSQQGLTDLLIFVGGIKSITLAPGEIKEIIARFVSSEELTTYHGTILIDNIKIPVTLKVSSLQFDSNIVVLNRDYKVSQGDELKTEVTLIPMGDKERLDVTLNYVIKDYAGKIYLTKSETVLVEDEIEFKRNFETGMLPLGDYVVGLELVYPGGVAPSSAHFEVVERSLEDVFGLILFLLVVGIVIIAILIILLLIKKRKKKENAE